MKALLHRFRANALSDRRVLRYAGYAAGELVLVVAGILIALAINNANQTRLRFVMQNIEPDLLRTLPLERGLRTDPAAVRREMARPAFVNLVHYQENVWALNERLARDGLALARRLRTRIGEAEVGGRPVLGNR